MKVSRTHIGNMGEVAMIKPTLRRNKTLVLKKPYEDVEINVTAEMLRELRQKLELSR